MIMPSKLYDILKLIAGIIPLIVTAFGTISLALGMNEDKVNVILIIIGAVGTFIKGLIEYCKAHYYKVKANDTVVEISQYDNDPSDVKEEGDDNV